MTTQILPKPPTRHTLQSTIPPQPQSFHDDDPAVEDSPWSRLNDVPSWAVSLAVHLLLLMVLAGMTRATVIVPDAQISSLIEEIDPEAYKFEATVVDTIGTDSTVNTLAPSQDAAQHVSRDPQEKMHEELKEEILDVQVPVTNNVAQPQESELLEQIDTTGATEHPGGVEGAMDRLAFEIANSLRDRKTLVIWLFDASQSLKARREAIADRFENVYRQLNELNAIEDKALKTAVARFGEQLELLTPEPVDDASTLASLVRDIKPDETGKENVFAAVGTLAKQWPEYMRPGTKTRRNVMIVIVTDERGDDYHLLEDVVHYVRRYGVRIHCVGNAAPFGREIDHVLWQFDDGSTMELPADRGPETVAPERLQLAFWGGQNSRELERMSSGYGPYALTRLCAESGGLYLVTEETRGPRFEPGIMRSYLPDYRPIRDYQEQLSKNLAKGALVQAATETKAENIPLPKLAFRADSDNVLRGEITEAQKPLAVLDYKLQRMEQMLEIGEKDRPKLDTSRWRASFDLAMGRVLAMRVRALGYNTVLADMKVQPKPFSTEGNNQWKLVPAREINGGPQVRKLAKKAEEYLTRVIDEHAGTPWAMLAERELGQPLGWDWQEGRINVAPPGGNGGNNKKTIQLAEEEEKKKKAMQKSKPAPPRVIPKI